MTITPVKIDGAPASPHVHADCLITRIAIPALRSGEATELVGETITLRCTRPNLGE